MHSMELNRREETVRSKSAIPTAGCGMTLTAHFHIWQSKQSLLDQR